MLLENICKSYTSKDGRVVTVFENFNLETESGSVTCITGASGTGKTTLLNIVSGLVKPDSGLVKREGEEAGRVSYLFQEPRLLPWRTALENCVLVCSDKQKATEYLSMAGLGNKLSAYPDELSGGERQRVALARALCFESSVVLMDEPFQNLDEAMRESLASDFFRILRQKKCSVLWVSHDLEAAKKYSDRIIAL